MQSVNKLIYHQFVVTVQYIILFLRVKYTHFLNDKINAIF
jgi:hypothetical protein